MMEQKADFSNDNPPIGFVTGGGLEANLQVKLTVPAQTVQEGAFVVMDSGTLRFYGLVTDLQLAAIDPNYASQLNRERFSPRLGQYLNQNTLYTNLAVMPALMMDRGPDPASQEYAAWAQNRPATDTPIKVKTVPDHHAPVKLANAEDIA